MEMAGNRKRAKGNFHYGPLLDFIPRVKHESNRRPNAGLVRMAFSGTNAEVRQLDSAVQRLRLEAVNNALVHGLENRRGVLRQACHLNDRCTKECKGGM
jgi:hypothetical protein